jgi:hypothetical protein
MVSAMFRMLKSSLPCALFARAAARAAGAPSSATHSWSNCLSPLVHTERARMPNIAGCREFLVSVSADPLGNWSLGPTEAESL